eukprot:5095859-Amphidinium_carterae.2
MPLYVPLVISKTAQAVSMAHASGATAAQISAAAEAEIRRTREQSESAFLQQQQRFIQYRCPSCTYS